MFAKFRRKSTANQAGAGESAGEIYLAGLEQTEGLSEVEKARRDLLLARLEFMQAKVSGASSDKPLSGQGEEEEKTGILYEPRPAGGPEGDMTKGRGPETEGEKHAAEEIEERPAGGEVIEIACSSGIIVTQEVTEAQNSGQMNDGGEKIPEDQSKHKEEKKVIQSIPTAKEEGSEAGEMVDISSKPYNPVNHYKLNNQNEVKLVEQIMFGIVREDVAHYLKLRAQQD